MNVSAGQLHDVVLRAPRALMHIAHTDLEARAPIEPDRLVEIAHCVDDMIEAAETGHENRSHAA